MPQRDSRGMLPLIWTVFQCGTSRAMTRQLLLIGLCMLTNQVQTNAQSSPKHLQYYIFIALIHPIQWTNAIPVGATGSPNVRKRRPVFPPASRS